MEMEVVVLPATEFNFDGDSSSAYATAPSSPQRFFFSEPASPTRAFLDDPIRHSSASPSSLSLLWEQQQSDENQDFEFGFSADFEKNSLSAADELFDCGKIRPFRPLQSATDGTDSPAAPAPPDGSSFQGNKINHRTFSSRREERDFDSDSDPMTAGANRTGKSETLIQQDPASKSGRKTSRSLSPGRVSDILRNSEENSPQAINAAAVSSPASNSKSSSPSSIVSAYASFLSSLSFKKGYRKWRLKDFLLFRSASEGRGTDKDPLRKYAVLSRKAASAAAEENVRNTSFRSASAESTGSVSRRRRGPVSAHELHYTVNRSVSEEMRKRTFLPYKQGLLGCMGFNPTGMHEISRGIGSLTRS